MQLLDEKLNPEQTQTLEQAARGSLRQNVYHYTSMLQTFVRPVGVQTQVVTAQELFAPGANWWAIAHVLPGRKVLTHLSDTQESQLLGRWYTALHEIASLLQEL